MLPFLHLFNHLFMSIWTHEYLFYSVGWNPLFILFLRLSQICPVEAPLSCLLCLFDMLPSFIKYSLAFWNHKTFMLVLYFPCPCSGINHFSKKLGFLLLETKRASCAHCFWNFVVSRHLLEDRTRNYIYIYTHTCVHTPCCIYFCNYPSGYILKAMSSH